MADPVPTGRPPRISGTGRVAGRGFLDSAAADRALRPLGLLDPSAGAVLSALSAAADPDLAVAGLQRLVEADPDRARLLATLRRRAGFRRRLTAVLGASRALADHLTRHPGDWRILLPDQVSETRPTVLGLQRTLLDAVGAAAPDAPAGGAGPEVLDRMRVAYRRVLLTLAARDLSGRLAVDDVAAELADLAAATLVAGLAVARAGLPPAAAGCRLAVIGMGKCGGRELNYASDVDVLFVAEPVAGAAEDQALRTATRLATGLMRACSAATSEGAIWPVDAGLRPEGRDGPLVRTLTSHEAYYRRWARPWEFQALLKARPVAGDPALGEAYLQRVAPLVWTAGDRAELVPEVRSMRRRVEDSLPRDRAGRELKLGPGGLRDVEFAVQLLQLVHGRADPALRSGTTLVALDALADGGYVGRADAKALAAAYRFLRATEHRLQLYRLRRTHTVPTEEAQLRALARALGYRADPVRSFLADWSRHAREVRRLHEKLFYRPLLTAAAGLPTDDVRLTPVAAGGRLEALGFAHPEAALGHISALTRGLSRRAAIQRTLLPVMLGWFAEAPDPDGGLLAFRQVSEALGASPWYLRLLRDEGATAERLARLLSTSRYLADLLTRAPDGVALLVSDDQLHPRPPGALRRELLACVGRNDDPEAAVVAARGLRRRELLRIAAADLLGLLDLTEVGSALTDVAAAAVAAALQAAIGRVQLERRGRLPVRLAVLGMGRFGGGEQGYGSDADVLFVYQPATDERANEVTQVAHAVAQETRRLLALPAPDPPLHVDADLRPEGRQGPLVRSLDSYAEYYRRWATAWEAQALLRARPVAGDLDLGRRFVELVGGLRYPPGGPSAGDLREIRRLKARMEAERLPRGADPSLHLKLGRGGLSDVEWAVQLLQLRHAHRDARLQVTGTLTALSAARDAGVLDAADHDVLRDAWRLAARIRNAVLLVRGRPSDVLPTELRTLAATAHVVGYPAARAADLVEDYRRSTRRARAVVERILYA